MIFIEFLRILFELIWHLAWPATILVIVYIFEKPIGDLIKRIKKISSGDKSIELDLVKIVSQQQQGNKSIDLVGVTKDTCNFEAYMNLMDGFTRSQVALIALFALHEDCYSSIPPIIKNYELTIKKLEKERPNDESVIEIREGYKKLYKIIKKVL